MTITKEVQGQLFNAETNKLICIPSRVAYPTVIAPMGGSMANSPVGSSGPSNKNAPWTEDEHARFLLGLELFPSGPWKSIADCVGTRTPRQTMSHAQKYRQKIARRQRPPTALAAEVAAQQHLEEFNDELLQQRLAQQHIASPPASASPAASPVASLMADGLSELHLTSEQIDEIIMSLLDDDNEPLLISSDDLEWLMAPQ